MVIPLASSPTGMVEVWRKLPSPLPAKIQSWPVSCMSTARSSLPSRLKSPATTAPGWALLVEPSLVADVEFSEWTGDDRLRHPSYKGVRDDKDPSQVVRERPEPQGGD